MARRNCRRPAGIQDATLRCSHFNRNKKTVVVRHIRQQRTLESVHNERCGYVERAVNTFVYLRRSSSKIQPNLVFFQSKLAMDGYFFSEHVRASFVLGGTSWKLFQSLDQRRLGPLTNLF